MHFWTKRLQFGYYDGTVVESKEEKSIILNL